MPVLRVLSWDIAVKGLVFHYSILCFVLNLSDLDLPDEVLDHIWWTLSWLELQMSYCFCSVISVLLAVWLTCFTLFCPSILSV